MPYICPVCGYPDLDEPPRSPLSGGGSYEICHSCGYEFGVDDDDRGISYEDWLKQWIEDGMPWRSMDIPPPPGWNPSEQIKHIPPSDDPW